MKYLSIILLILICSCNNANQKTQSIPIDTTENDNEDEVYTPSVHVDGYLDSTEFSRLNSGYKIGGSLGCVLYDSIHFKGQPIGVSPFHLPTAKLPKVHINSKGIIDTISGLNDGNVGPFLYLPTKDNLTIKDNELIMGPATSHLLLRIQTAEQLDHKKGFLIGGDTSESFIWLHEDGTLGAYKKTINIDTFLILHDFNKD